MSVILFGRSGAVNITANPMLFVDHQVLRTLDSRLWLQPNPPALGARVLWPTEPWESWAVFAYNHVLQIAPDQIRMYYDCISASQTGKIGSLCHLCPGCAERNARQETQGLMPPPKSYPVHSYVLRYAGGRYVCLAESSDGVNFTKPDLGIFDFEGSTHNNIIAACSGVSVFHDTARGVPATEQWKMVWSSADTLRCNRGDPDVDAHVPRSVRRCISNVSKDDTKDTAVYDSRLGRYIIFVRRDVQVPNRSAGVVRYVGRCETDDLGDWEKFTPN
eukprot:gene4641-4841_t